MHPQATQRSPQKAVVCFSGARDQYQTAWALAEEGLLEKLVTDFYLNPDRLPFGHKLEKSFPKLWARFCPAIPSRHVITPPKAMARSFLMRTRFGSVGSQVRLDWEIGRRARVEAWKTGAALLSYSYYAFSAFASGKNQPALRILFQLHPHPGSVRRILREEMSKAPAFAASLRWEHEIGAPEPHFKALCSESALANGWIAASTFTASTMVEHGVPRDQIHVVPYGVDATKYPCRDKPPRRTDPFRIVWVGNMTQRKGLSYFLDAIASIPQENLQVIVCGHHAVELDVIKNRGLGAIQVLQGLPTHDLTQVLRASDLFVLPSLAEGFGHVILEAMSSGLPVLTTHSTCAPDIMEDSKHGFIVPSGESEALAKRITWARQHRPELYQMGLAAAAQARLFTWERFRRGIVRAFMAMTTENRTRARMPHMCEDVSSVR